MNINFKNFFLTTEAIRLKTAKKMRLRRKHGGAYHIKAVNEVFNNKDRLIFPLELKSHKLSIEDIPLIEKINSFLLKHFQNLSIKSIEEYKNGIIFFDNDTEKKQGRRIGKILNRFPSDADAKSLADSFKKDPLRSAKNNTYKVVISRHPYDIAGMSTDRNWRSCMDLGLPGINYPNSSSSTGVNKHFVPADISTGSIIAYLVPSSDVTPSGKTEIRRPLSRILMKPHFTKNRSDVAYSMGRTYGAPISEFSEFIKNWLKNTMNKDKQDKTFYFPSNLYSDGDVAVNFIKQNEKDSIVEEEFFDLLTYNFDNDKFRRFFEIQQLEDGLTAAELRITFELPDNSWDSFRYENESIPKIFKRLLTSDYLPDIRSLYMIQYFKDSKNLVLEYSLRGYEYNTEDQYENEEGKTETYPIDEDSLHDIWRDSLENHNIEDIDYKSARKEIINFVKSTNIENKLGLAKEEQKRDYEKLIIDTISGIKEGDKKIFSYHGASKENFDKLTSNFSEFKKHRDIIKKFGDKNPSLQEIVDFYTIQNGKESLEFYRDYLHTYRFVRRGIVENLRYANTSLLSYVETKKILDDILSKTFNDVESLSLHWKLFRGDNYVEFIKSLNEYRKKEGQEKYDIMEDIIEEIQQLLR